MNETPYCSALLSAEFIQQDVAGKWNISGIYDVLRVTSFPCEFSTGVFFAVTDGRGEMPLRIQIVNNDDLFKDLETTPPAGLVEGTIVFPDPLLLIQDSVILQVHFDQPGAFQLELWVNDQRLQTRRLMVIGPVEES